MASHKSIPFITLILCFIATTFCSQSLNQEAYTLKPLENTAGIFYHNLGYAKIHTDYFSLLSYTNISLINKRTVFVKSTYDNTLMLCSKLPGTGFCQEPLKLIKIQIPQLETKFETIINLVGHREGNKRKRRGLFNGVSYAFNWLFGTPDADDAKYYSDSIKSLFQQNHDIQALMRQQIHIMSDAIQNYNNTAQTLQSNEEKLNYNILQFNNFSESTSNKIQKLELTQVVSRHVNLLSQMISDLNEEIDIQISAILFAKQKIIHPSVITPTNLQKELLKIQLNTNVRFPIALNDVGNIYKYFSICDLNVIYDQELLIFAIKIPLVLEQLFNLFNLIPLPVSYENSSVYSYIDPSYPFLLLSTTKAQYSRLKDLSTCKKISSEDYLCSETAIYLTAERPVCETILRTKLPNELPEDCPTRTIKADIELWHPLSTNSWLYVISNKTSASISCSKENIDITEVTIQGIGIFQLHSNCKCYTFSTVLYATSNRTSNYSNYLPSFDITKSDCCLYQREFLKTKAPHMALMKINHNNLDELRHSKHKLEQFDEILRDNMNQSYFHRSVSWISTTTAIILIMALSIILSCCCCNCSWLPIIGRFFPNRPSYCGLPNICITNHNERLELTDRQLIQLRLRHLEEQDEAADRFLHSTSATAISPPSYQHSPSAPRQDIRPRKATSESRFQI